MNLEPGDITTLTAFSVVLLVHAVVIARWSARLDTIVKKIQEEITEIRSIVTGHARDLEALKISVEVERQVRMQVDRALKNGIAHGP